MKGQPRNQLNMTPMATRPTQEQMTAELLASGQPVQPMQPQQPSPVDNIIGSLGQGAKGLLQGFGDFVNAQKDSPEGRLLLNNMLAGVTVALGADPVIGANIVQQGQEQFKLGVAKQEKEQESLLATAKRQADIDADVEKFRQKELIKAEIEAPEKQRELEEEQKLEKKKAVNAFMSAQEVISGIDNLLKEDPKTGSKRFEVAVGPIEGRTSGMALPTKKGEKSFQINKEIATLLAKKALNTITEMKNASRTGATGFGAMNEKELGLIQDDIASLDTRLSDKAFEASLNRIKQRMQKVMSQIDITEQDRLSLQQEDPLGIL
jgi:hypothetical protein